MSASANESASASRLNAAVRLLLLSAVLSLLLRLRLCLERVAGTCLPLERLSSRMMRPLDWLARKATMVLLLLLRVS